MGETTIQNGWEIIRFDGDTPSTGKATIAIEFPITIVLNGKEFATIICTPTNLRELLIGFLASEGMIRFFDEINTVTIDQEKGFAYVEIDKTLDGYKHDHSKRFIGSCCGKSRQFYFKSDVQTAKTVNSRLSIGAAQCISLMQQLQTGSEHFQMTGGVHNAALCTISEILTIRTDIGRHNALDKIYGTILENHIPVNDKLIVFSGRISSEVLLKVSKIGIGILVSKSAPTDLALRLADDLGITTVGFVRDNKMNVYTHPHRIHETNKLRN